MGFATRAWRSLFVGVVLGEERVDTPLLAEVVDVLIVSTLPVARRPPLLGVAGGKARSA